MEYLTSFSLDVWYHLNRAPSWLISKHPLDLRFWLQEISCVLLHILCISSLLHCFHMVLHHIPSFLFLKHSSDHFPFPPSCQHHLSPTIMVTSYLPNFFLPLTSIYHTTSSGKTWFFFWIIIQLQHSFLPFFPPNPPTSAPFQIHGLYLHQFLFCLYICLNISTKSV